MAGFKVRLGDGSEIGPMDLAALRTWLAQGLVDGDSPVMRPGSRKWVALRSIPELKGALGVSRPKAPARSVARERAAERAEEVEVDDEPTAVDHVRVRVVAALAATSTVIYSSDRVVVFYKDPLTSGVLDADFGGQVSASLSHLGC